VRRNGRIWQVFARAGPSALEIDPIIGLSQKKDYFNSDPRSSVTSLDFQPTGSEVLSPSPLGKPLMAHLDTHSDDAGSESRSAHSSDSSLREKIIEHAFVADLLRNLWRRGRRDVEVLRAEVDRGGYDVVFHCNGVMRHVQLKSSHRGASTAKITASLKLKDKPAGCIIWIMFDQETLELGPYLWFGSEPGKVLPDLGDKVAKHSKANSQGKKLPRLGLRDLWRGSFTKLRSMDEVVARLFGLHLDGG